MVWKLSRDWNSSNQGHRRHFQIKNGYNTKAVQDTVYVESVNWPPTWSHTRSFEWRYTTVSVIFEGQLKSALCHVAQKKQHIYLCSNKHFSLRYVSTNTTKTETLKCKEMSCFMYVHLCNQLVGYRGVLLRCYDITGPTKQEKNIAVLHKWPLHLLEIGNCYISIDINNI